MKQHKTTINVKNFLHLENLVILVAMKFLVAVLFMTYLSYAANETCSRVAVVNYQEVLVDFSSSKPGEGLRYYLEKDKKAKVLLDEYQEKSKPSWRSAAISTTGTLMMLGGALSSGNRDTFGDRNLLFFGGLSIIVLNYFYSKEDQSRNEHLLQRSVNEYNKRNNPKIYFSPFGDGDKSIGVSLGITEEF